MSEAFFEWPAAQAMVAWILMQDGRKQKCSKETACHFIRQSGSESLAVPSSALAISGKIIVRLRDTGFERTQPKVKGSVLSFTNSCHSQRAVSGEGDLLLATL